VSLSLTYNDDLSRVQVTGTGLSGSGEYATVERSLNEQLWLPVRGALRLPINSNEAFVDDFEFFADVENHYRLRVFDDTDSQLEEFTDSVVPDLEGQVWVKSPHQYPLLNRPVLVADWSDVGRGSRSMVHAVTGRSLPISANDKRLSRQFDLVLVTDDVYDPSVDGEAQAGEWDIVFATGEVFFIHVPADQPIPGGYVVFGETNLRRLSHVSREPYELTLSCTEVLPPAPQITGGLLVANTIFRLYGDANALYAAHSTGRSLLQTIGSPEDLVVV
jgi:hypothetical protein